MGYLRLALSLIIMASHLVYVGNAWGGTSLVIFYILSGYGITASGIKPGFWQRRLWRLWPSYLAIAVVTQLALLLGWIPGRPYMALATGWDAVAQFFMIVPTWPEPALVPTAWMIKWLIVGYALMWMGASNTPQRTALWVLLSLVASIFWMSRTQSYGLWYQSFLCASLATSIGAACYHLGLIAPRDGRWAAFAGSLSYPVFLAHYGVGAAVASITGWAPGWPLFRDSLLPTLAISIALVLWVEQPIARYRRRPTP
jgi:peptidoglycan/LPS O-acetylase OafA/YrhL